MRGLQLAFLSLAIVWVSPIFAQTQREQSSPPNTRHGAPGNPRSTSVRAGRLKPGQLQSGNHRQSDAPTKSQPRGGIFQQFKSFTNSVMGSGTDDEAPADLESMVNEDPEILEARRRRLTEPFSNRAIQRNQSAIERGMPAPPRDPPSLPDASRNPASDESQSTRETLPPIESASKQAFPKPANSAVRPSSAEPIELLGNAPGQAASSNTSSRRARGGSTALRDQEKSSQHYVGTKIENPSDDAVMSGDSTQSDDSVNEDTSSTESDSTWSVIETDKANSSPVLSSESSETKSAPMIPPARIPQTFAGTTNHPSTLLQAEPRPTKALASMGLPKVELALHGAPSLQVHSKCVYELVATNQDSVPLNGLIARLGIPSSVTASLRDSTMDGAAIEEDPQGGSNVVWQLESLAPGQSKSLSFELTASRAEHFAVDIEWTALPQTASAAIEVEQAMLQLAFEGASEVIYGRPEIYRLRIRNPGNADAKNVDVLLQADSFGENSANIGDVPAGSERIVEVELTFQHPGSLPISARAKSSSLSLESSASIDVRVLQASLDVTWEGPESQFQGSIAEYLVTIVNQSDTTTENVECLINLPNNAIASSSSPATSLRGQQVAIRIPKLQPGEATKVPLEIQLNESGDFQVELTCQGSAGASTQSTGRIHVDSISDLKLSVIDPVAPAPVGSQVVYEIAIQNRGSKEATGVRVLAQFSNGIEPIKANGGAHRLVPGQVVFEPIDKVPAGATVKLQVIAQASESGMHRFRAEVTCDDQDTQLLEEESTRYLATKKTDSSGSSSYRR